MVLIPEICGFEQVSVLGYIAAKTERIELMSGIGTSGAQVIEGWHGSPFKRPLDERETLLISVARSCLATRAPTRAKP